MLKLKSLRYLVIGLMFLLVGCAGSRARMSSMKTDSGKTVAVVSFAVNNYGFIGKGPINDRLIAEHIDGMLKDTESLLGKRWKVKPATAFIKNPGYLHLSVGHAKSGLVTPIVAGKVMPSFTDSRKEIIKGEMDPATAKKLCAALGVDSVVLVYSEWTISQGKFVPTIKALTKNCISMFNKDGKRLFFARKDVAGSNVIGSAFTKIYINEGTIDQWTNAYLEGVKSIFKL
jgi:hypothetical protein